ncbi:hypothetical protein GNI_062360 [Gregarina niphandrodes]|uniref:Transmembrane protein n=1 Tax=Gregarina niphandrodes TaxID=110365 RepID=A0A023B892_GRENI|nr:hypothetical protein GNI_062360 [Gregarina niphandrodes]EZG68427.1 hypothetical protein GNI_062360 [Gregarina niphandrodes]|eukprot:XP_011134581.1 hypothetical protein GNI_062360 [Gregarina niphandrodes]
MSARHCPVSSNAAVCLLYPLLKFVTVFCGGRDAVPLDDVETVLRQAFNNSKLYGYSPLLHGAFEEEPVYDDSNWEQDLSSRKRAAHDVRRGEVWKGEMGKRELGKGEREVGNVEAFNPRVLKTRALKPRLSRVEFHLPERNDSFADADPEDPSPDDPSPDDPSLDVCEDWSRPLVFVEDMLTPTPARRHLQRVWSDRRPARRHGMALGRKWGRQRRWDWWRRLWRNKSHRAHWIADDVLAFWRQCKRKGYTNDKQLRDAALATTGNRGTGSFMMSVKDIDGLVIVDENGRKARYLEFLDPGYSSLETGYSSLETGYSSPETADRKSLGRRTSSSRGLKPYFLRRFSGKPLAAQVVTDGATRRRLDSWVSPAPEQGSRQENYQGRQLLHVSLSKSKSCIYPKRTHYYAEQYSFEQYSFEQYSFEQYSFELLKITLHLPQTQFAQHLSPPVPHVHFGVHLQSGVHLQAGVFPAAAGEQQHPALLGHPEQHLSLFLQQSQPTQGLGGTQHAQAIFF